MPSPRLRPSGGEGALRRLARLLLAALPLAAVAPGPARAQGQAEASFAFALLGALQPLSVAKGREFCGLIGRGADGALAATEPVAGGRTACDLPPPKGLEVVATFHTHGAPRPGFLSELPSEADMRLAGAMGVDGWIATSGGRLWHVDSERMTAQLICGVACLAVAPGFTKRHGGKVAPSYTLDQLLDRFAQ